MCERLELGWHFSVSSWAGAEWFKEETYTEREETARGIGQRLGFSADKVAKMAVGERREISRPDEKVHEGVSGAQETGKK